jgi:hypothetical protein
VLILRQDWINLCGYRKITADRRSSVTAVWTERILFYSKIKNPRSLLKTPPESRDVKTLSIVRNSKYEANTTFRRLDLFGLHVSKGRHLCWAQLSRLAFSNGPNRVGVFLLSLADGGRSSFQNTVSASYFEFLTMDKAFRPVILSVQHRRQNPLNSTETFLWPFTLKRIFSCKFSSGKCVLIL